MAEILLPALIVLGEALLRLAGLALALRRTALPAVAAEGRVVLILPLAGEAPGLEELFAALAAQSLPPARLIVAVEHAEDPAARRAASLAARLPFPVEIVAAGRHDGRGQKNTNLIAALARLPPEAQAVAMFDADIRPPPWWLSALATPLLRGEADLVTGYRWPLPGEGRGGVAAELWAALDRGFALMPKPRAMAFAWGGSLAIAPAALARMELPRRLDRTLSDDLTIGAAARELGLRVLRRRALMLPTPTEGGAGEILGFAVRQFRILRLYRPGWWAAGAAATALALAAWIALGLQALAGASLAQAVLAFAMLAGLARLPAQGRIAAILGLPRDPPRTAWAQAALAALPPLVAAFAAILFAASVRPRFIRWRHVDYAVEGPERIRVLARR
jgi:hypothetical protein